MDTLLNLPWITSTRRNHALEHAAVHILSARFPRQNMGGHSNPTGFFIFGDLPTEDVRSAVSEALARLQHGETDLAIHPGCGTNYAVTGALAALFAVIGLSGTRNTRQRLERFPLLMSLSVLAMMIAPPLGMALQRRVTTEPNPGPLTVLEVTRVSKTVHRVVTRS
jgi:hypothetical protein